MANRLTQAKLEALYSAIGRFVLTWAEVETYLDLLVLRLRKSPEDIPHQLAPKIRFARQRLETLNTLAAREALNLLREIEGLADTRHDYVHGSRIGYSVQRSKLSITLGRLLQPQSRPRRKPIKVTAAEIDETTDRLYQIAGALLDVLEALVST